MNDTPAFYSHPTAIIESNVHIGAKTKIWHYCHVRTNSTLGEDISLGKGVFIDEGVEISDGSRIQNGVSIYRGVIIKEWVFVGPNVTFTNDLSPRAGSKDWSISETMLMPGCSIGAGSILISGITIGAFAMIGAGSVLSENVPPFHLAYGLPARIISKICACGRTRLNMETFAEMYIQDCCHQNLNAAVIKLAKQQLPKR
jgi:UDP-2-acetamido-3-amino-2,3-dideoxy-glucuronate N-acetyltransferase